MMAEYEQEINEEEAAKLEGAFDDIPNQVVQEQLPQQQEAVV